MSAASPHPTRLPWFAAGTLPPAEAAGIERHLAACAACRAEVKALRSMTRTLRAFAPAGHVAPELLVAYHRDRAALSSEERARVQDHLGSCLSCTADLRALERAEASLHTVSRRRLLGAAASVLAVVLTGWQIAGWRAPAPLLHVHLMPPQRGDAQRIPAGPCVLDVLLPEGAVDGTYVARIALPEGVTLPLEPSVSKDQWLSLAVPGGLGPGRHVLYVGQQGGNPSDAFAYGLDVEASP
ncbi:MAG TPA: zf-HC2 domain-containing protein [Candidatus Polarisedimenticolaceae bacterium]|nr:zf-HC2 domain-containing protein [Candidatus Polarisedimenticolaceae bacterium]